MGANTKDGSKLTGLILARRRRQSNDLLVKARPNDAAPSVFGDWLFDAGAPTHATTGALTGPGSEVVGSANRFRAFDTSGALTGPGSTIAGSASRAVTALIYWVEADSSSATTHDTSGALTGPGAVVAGSANRFREFSTSGALVGQGSTLSGSATRFRTFSTTGALTGQGSTLAGTATRFRAHDTSGALTGQGSTLAGTAQRFRAFDTSGALVGPGAVIAGSASRSSPATAYVYWVEADVATGTVHGTTGALTGPGSSLSGSASRFRTFSTSGALVGQGSAVVGTADRSRVAVTHDTSGALVGPGSIVEGAATNGTVQPEVSYSGGWPEAPDSEAVRKQREDMGILPKKKPRTRSRVIRRIEAAKQSVPNVNGIDLKIWLALLEQDIRQAEQDAATSILLALNAAKQEALQRLAAEEQLRLELEAIAQAEKARQEEEDIVFVLGMLAMLD